MTDLNLITSEDLKMLAAELYQLIKKEAEENNQEDILNAKQAAKLLDLSTATIYGKTHRNEIPYFKQGKKLLFSRTALLDWLRKGENPAVTVSPASARSKAAEYLHQNRRF
ncbi:helix-turn-helix domain-containing protein [Salinimicrobium sediminilitoris]|uniref:helix-turn-helix domain-containing protein n=1 Tax=Salinimicrobium sediminilitoris TaxID=2876715 RepID=UPI001E434291|nr:helix-turn-helix domain-containing protein [Salinimicrobium sediminilitoris]MCC8361001.1 helix-turn-helix domain-containing protein [Salinimicrobium sediminilitoris]